MTLAKGYKKEEVKRTLRWAETPTWGLKSVNDHRYNGAYAKTNPERKDFYAMGPDGYRAD